MKTIGLILQNKPFVLIGMGDEWEPTTAWPNLGIAKKDGFVSFEILYRMAKKGRQGFSVLPLSDAPKTVCLKCGGLGDDNVTHQFNKCGHCQGAGKVGDFKTYMVCGSVGITVVDGVPTKENLHPGQSAFQLPAKV